MNIKINEKGQAVCNQSMKFGRDDFKKIEGTEIRWLGGGGVYINSRGTTCMIDPVLEGFDLPLLYEVPISVDEIKYLDAVLITHMDNDHFSIPTCLDIQDVCKSYHATSYVASVMQENGIQGIGHAIYDTLHINDIQVQLTKAVHNWQNGSQKYHYREWKVEDYCGFYIETVDGAIWMPGDSQLIDEQLTMKEPDVILFDFSDNEWHITLNGAIKLANTYPNADLICIHWGSVDAPNLSPFNGNPQDLVEKVVNPDRIQVLAPGEVYML